MPERRNGFLHTQWELRSDGRTAWVAVTDPGRHFQCDFDGDMVKGPVHRHDFREDPPLWVIEGLDLS